MNKQLLTLRMSNNKTQRDMAKLTGVTLQSYHAIEHSTQPGSIKFWKEVQKIFNIPNSQMWEVMTNNEQ